MIRLLAFFIAVFAAIALFGCGEVPPQRGSAQENAAGASARAESTAKLADSAEIDAAAKDAAAKELERKAAKDPTPDRIRAADDARVEAASSRAVAEALRRQSSDADNAAKIAAVAARSEREAEARAASDLAWVSITRLVGMVGVGAGVMIGGILAWLVTPRIGALAGLLVASTGIACTAYGASLRWMPLAVLASVVVALVAWAMAHWHAGRVGVALSHALDATESDPHPTMADEINDAKKNLGKAVAASGLAKRFEKLRGSSRTWGRRNIDI